MERRMRYNIAVVVLLLVIISDESDGMIVDRPLLHKFGRGISQRIQNAKLGYNRSGQVGAYTSEEILPCLDMECNVSSRVMSSRRAIGKAFIESSRIQSSNNDSTNDITQQALPHGRSSGSGCTIIRLKGKDAVSIRGLTEYSNRFFQQVDNDDTNDDIKDAGVFRIDNYVYAGFDEDVNSEGRMQFLDTRLIPSEESLDPLLLPLEVENLVGKESLQDAHKGMDILLDIGTQITSAILDMDQTSAEKLIDDGTLVKQSDDSENEQQGYTSNDVSNSYHRLIRYLKPQAQSVDTPAFQAHVDSTFLTLIPMPKLPGLEVWCPSYSAESTTEGEWVKPIVPLGSTEEDNEQDAYVIAMAGEFLQLTSNGEVPTCIHRVIPPKPPAVGTDDRKYQPRISSPMFLRPRRGDDALLDVGVDLTLISEQASSSCADALYFEEGLIDECDGEHLWSAHSIL